MSNRVLDRKQLIWLLDHELRGARRHRRFMTLVLLSGEEPELDFSETILETLRESDEFYAGPDWGAVVMTDTDGHGAMNAISRYRRMQPALSHVATATFPRDNAQSGMDLLRMAEIRLTDVEDEKSFTNGN